jgi:hypothetical protein
VKRYTTAAWWFLKGRLILFKCADPYHGQGLLACLFHSYLYTSGLNNRLELWQKWWKQT